MEIKDLKPKQGKVDIVVDVTDVPEPRQFNKYGVAGKVTTAAVRDATGEAKLSLWNEDTERVKKGMKIHITNGYVGEYQGEMQLTAGRFGKIEIVGEAAAGTEDEKTEDAAQKTDSGEKTLTETPEEGVFDSVEEKVE